MYCLKCGKEIRDDSVFCSGCGAKQNTEGITNDKFNVSRQSTVTYPVIVTKGILSRKMAIKSQQDFDEYCRLSNKCASSYIILFLGLLILALICVPLGHSEINQVIAVYGPDERLMKAKQKLNIALVLSLIVGVAAGAFFMTEV